MIDNGDICVSCKQPQMPKWGSESVSARSCQSCGYEETKGIVLELLEYVCPTCGRRELMSRLMSIPCHKHRYGKEKLQTCPVLLKKTGRSVTSLQQLTSWLVEQRYAVG